MNKFPIVEVEWLDAQHGSGITQTIEELIKCEPLITSSVGYLIFKNKEKLILSMMMFGEELSKHDQLIPIGMVKRINYLKEKENSK
jgi:hypothetical protein